MSTVVVKLTHSAFCETGMDKAGLTIAKLVGSVDNHIPGDHSDFRFGFALISLFTTSDRMDSICNRSTQRAPSVTVLVTG